jgi:PAS domain S-box-containing protein
VATEKDMSPADVVVLDPGGEPRRGADNEELFRLLVASVRDYAIFMLDPQGVVATWNIGAERIKGYRANEIVGRHFSVFYPEEDIRAGKPPAELEAATRDGRFEDEGWRLRKDGTRFWASVVISAVRDATGALVGFSKVTRDLSERKRIAVELERYRRIVESVRDYAIFMLDSTGHVTTWNRGAQAIKGYAAGEIIGQHFSVFYPEEDVRAGKCDMELVVAAREGRFEDEGWRLRKDGTRFWANVIISAMRDESGAVIGFSKVTRDLSERKRTEEDRAARLAAERANQAKDEFLAMLGHELRNPLAPILTAVQLMKLRGLAPREHEIIERQAKHMMHLVEDLLDVSRITRGTLELRRRRVDVRDIVARGIETAAPIIEARRHRVTLDATASPVEVDGDEARLTQIISNLLVNAARYTDPGGNIRVAVHAVGGEVVVEVADDGGGIAPELLPRIFDLFVQGAQSVDRAQGGLGIGLTLVKTLVALHGGTVEAASPGVGAGSTFTVRLPLLEAQAGDSGAHAAARLEVPLTATPRRVLVVDDNADALALLAEALRAVGHEVHTAANPVDALRTASAVRPDVAVLDIGLPAIDGYELAARLRAALGDATPRLIALTGYAQPSDLERSSRAGFERHLVKPVDIRQLIDVVAER